MRTQAALQLPHRQAWQALTCHFKSGRAELTATAHLGKSFEDGGCSSPLAKQRQGLSCMVSGAARSTAAHVCPFVDAQRGNTFILPAHSHSQPLGRNHRTTTSWWFVSKAAAFSPFLWGEKTNKNPKILKYGK